MCTTPMHVGVVPTTPFRVQVVNLQALPLEKADTALALLCPVHTLRQYVNRTQSFRTSKQLFVCYGGQQKGEAVSKQRMAHWLVDGITLAYEAQGAPCPLRLHTHSTRGVASSWALARGASLANICRAAGWATHNTFATFYSLHVKLTPNSPESSLTMQTLSSLPALWHPDVAENPAPGLSANSFLKSDVRLVPTRVTLLGFHMCFPQYSY